MSWHERNQQANDGIANGTGKTRSDYRFCESCRSYKPKDKRPAKKGWVCTDCVMVKA